MSAQDNLSSRQFFHGTDASLEPGTVIRPGSEIGNSTGSHAFATGHAPGARAYGENVYKVEPVGEVEQRPGDYAGHPVSIVASREGFRVVEPFTPRTMPTAPNERRANQANIRAQRRARTQRATTKDVQDIMDLL